MNKIEEYERMLDVIKTESLHYENAPGLACTPEKARSFRISCVEELINYEKSRVPHSPKSNILTSITT